MRITQSLSTAEETVEAGRQLALAMRAVDCVCATVFLRGDLGAGKTTFARGFLSGCGHEGRVPSPTYTLVEPYELKQCIVYHIDLYRLTEPAQVDDLALSELADPGAILLIEWPERAWDRIGPADLDLALALDGDGRSLCLTAVSPAGERVLTRKIG